VAGVLIAMRLRVLAHTLTGSRAAAMISGGIAGLLLAAGTIALAGSDLAPGQVRGDLLAIVLACWMFGWILGPVYTGGGDDSLRPEQFSLLPLRPLPLAFGLLTAGFVGIAPAVSLIAFTALIAHAQGVAAVAVAVIAVVLQLILVLMLSRLVVGVLAVAVRSRLGAILAALVNASMAVLLNQSWVLIWAAVDSDLLTYGFPPRFSAVLHWLPSSWGMVAIDAAGRGDWLLAAAAVGGLAALIGAALAVWARLLARRTTTRAGMSAGRGWLLDRFTDGGTTRAVAVKELRTWSRDLMRIHFFYYSVFFGVLYTLVPLIIDWRGMLPWTGVIIVAMAAATSANLFGLDGTALWLNLVNPGGELAEVRGRQLAWLLQTAPVTLLITVVGTIVAGGDPQTWAWALALLFAALGGGAGLIVLVSVFALVPVLEPKRRSGNPLEAGPVFGQIIGTLLLVCVTTVPAVVVAWAGTRSGQPLLTWAAVPAALATGAWFTWWCGRAAARRLRATGPELLATMRSGGTVTAVAVRPGAAKLPPRLSALVTTMWIACWVPLFPQGIVPLWMIFSGSENRLWFLALYLDDPWRIPVAAAFMLLGLAMLTVGTVIPLRYGRLQKSAAR
jgi:ABC-2 type transport system permease protein